jgi:Zn-dependent metalloprotease
MRHKNGHHPIHCIVPPHMLEELAENGTPAQREFAERTLASEVSFREERQVGLLQFAAAQIKPAATADKQRTVYDAQNRRSLPGVKVRGEGDPATGDKAVDEAYEGSGATYDFYRDLFERNSIDDKGMPLSSTVHFDQGFDNAFWDGQQMVYGDGDEDLPPDQRLFNRFTIDIAIIAHELTHGVTGFEARLVYEDQPGALNEHFSDVFGSLVKQRLLQHIAAQADWVVGEGLFTSNVNGAGIRSMKAPGTAYDDPVLGKDPQPGHMGDYVRTNRDNGGVHINSGIPNRAFYLAATALGGFAWEKAGRIWYLTLRDMLRARSDFAEAASYTIAAAGQLYGMDSAEQAAVRDAWEAVGLGATVAEPRQKGCFNTAMRALGR